METKSSTCSEAGRSQNHISSRHRGKQPLSQPQCNNFPQTWPIGFCGSGRQGMGPGSSRPPAFPLCRNCKVPREPGSRLKANKGKCFFTPLTNRPGNSLPKSPATLRPLEAVGKQEFCSSPQLAQGLCFPERKGLSFPSQGVKAQLLLLFTLPLPFPASFCTGLRGRWPISIIPSLHLCCFLTSSSSVSWRGEDGECHSSPAFLKSSKSSLHPISVLPSLPPFKVFPLPSTHIYPAEGDSPKTQRCRAAHIFPVRPPRAHPHPITQGWFSSAPPVAFLGPGDNTISYASAPFVVLK